MVAIPNFLEGCQVPDRRLTCTLTLAPLLHVHAPPPCAADDADGPLASAHLTAPAPPPLVTALFAVFTRLRCDAQLLDRHAGGLSARSDTVCSRYADRIGGLTPPNAHGVAHPRAVGNHSRGARAATPDERRRAARAPARAYILRTHPWADSPPTRPRPRSTPPPPASPPPHYSHGTRKSPFMHARKWLPTGSSRLPLRPRVHPRGG